METTIKQELEAKEIMYFVEEHDEIEILRALVGKFDYLFQDGVIRNSADIKTIEIALQQLKGLISWEI